MLLSRNNITYFYNCNLQIDLKQYSVPEFYISFENPTAYHMGYFTEEFFDLLTKIYHHIQCFKIIN